MAVEYKLTQDVANAGQQSNMVPATMISRTVETDPGIEFGKPVMQGVADKGVVLASGSGIKFVGITVLDNVGRYGYPNGFALRDSARVMTKGVIWVEAAVAVAAGDPVTVTTTGTFSNTGGTAIANARWDTSAQANGLAQVRLG